MASVFSIGTPFIELEQVESTNNYATRLAHEGMAQHGTTVFAHHQTKGKGQRYKQWYGEAGKNIALSIVLQPGIIMHQSFLMSMTMAIAVQRFFENYAGGETKIKWPNDIYWRDRKAAGILIENIVQGTEWKWSIIGIGININQTSFEEVFAKATSLKQITGKNFDPLLLAKELCVYVMDAYQALLADSESIISTYKNFLFKLNEEVRLKKEARVFTAVIKDVRTTGHLIVQTATEESFEVGEVEWIL